MKKANNEEIISRRQFFKKAAGMLIPAVAMTVLPSILTSCEIDEPYPSGGGGGNTGCSGCSTSCKGSCKGTCYTGCSGSCSRRCSSSCSFGSKK